MALTNGMAFSSAFDFGTVVRDVLAAAPSIIQAATARRAIAPAPVQALETAPGVFTAALPPALANIAGGAARALTGLSVVGGALRVGARALLRAISTRIGQRITGKQVVALVKRVGPEAAAAALGVTVAELMQIVTAEQLKHRRRRGISARDISRARSTINRMTGFMARVQMACSPVRSFSGSRRRRRHAAGCRCAICVRG